jgi:hypothetical protein
MYSEYFENWEVRSHFSKEFVSLWPCWLGKDNLHKLDEVTEIEWNKFNKWISLIAERFTIKVVDCELEATSDFEHADLSTYQESMSKDRSLFSKFIIPKLGCVITEEWDYTYIIWHKNNEALEALLPSIENARLEHFNE